MFFTNILDKYKHSKCALIIYLCLGVKRAYCCIFIDKRIPSKILISLATKKFHLKKSEKCFNDFGKSDFSIERFMKEAWYHRSFVEQIHNFSHFHYYLACIYKVSVINF